MLSDSLEGWDGVGGRRQRFRRKGTYVYLWLIHVDVWQKPTQYYEAIILQLKINTFLKNRLLPLQGAWVQSLVGELRF